MSAMIYKCPNCGGSLVFDPKSGKYVCEYCFSKFAQEDLPEQTAKERLEETPKQEEHSIKEETPETGATAVEYHCPSCGAEIITEETTAATFCFYCHSPIVLSGKLEGTYQPDGVIPFRVTKEEAVGKFQEWIQRKKFIPHGFYSKRQIEKMSGVYFPYWIYEGETESGMNGTARDLRVWRVGDTEYTETKTFAIRRQGTVTFRHLPKTALAKAQNALLKGIFPYDFSKTESFHMGFLSGFQAEKRDIEKESLTEEIHQEIREYAEKRMRDTISGHNSFSMENQSCEIETEKFRYMLLPVWIMTYRQGGKRVYYFAMNGQTGEIVGKLPVDSKKLVCLAAAVFFVVFILMLLGGLLL